MLKGRGEDMTPKDFEFTRSDKYYSKLCLYRLRL